MEDNKGSVVTTSVKDLITFKTMDDLRKWGDEVAKSGFTPLKTGAGVVAAVITGQELGLSPMFSANNIYPINGKSTLGVHLINKLLLQAGIVAETIRDFEPCVNFVMKGANGQAIFLDKDNKEVPLENGKPVTPASAIVIREGFADESARENEIKGTRIVNYKTIVRLKRWLKQPNGTFELLTVFGSYSHNEAAIAGLLDKDNWKKYERTMCETRALVFGGRRIADDVLGGLPETSEFADTHNIPYTVEEGKITIIQQNQSQTSANTENVSETTTIIEVKEEASNDGSNNSSN